MARSGPGWCPFATQIEGVTTYTVGGETKVGFCDHTAGGFYSTLINPVFWNGAGVSVHFAISRKGEVGQIVNIFDTAFAQGRDSRGESVGPTSPGITWLPFDQMGKRNPNGYLISTEHEDYELVNGVSHSIPGSQWTEAEFDADRRVKAWCIAETQRVKSANLMKFGIDSLASHHMFDPVNRAYCAGAYWRNEYRQRLFAALTFGPAPVPVEEEIMTRFNSVAPALQGKTAPFTVQLSDFDPAPPAGTKRLSVEIYINAQVAGPVQVKDSDGKYAGQVGWDGARYGVVEVDVSGGSFSVEGRAAVAQVGIVAIA